MGADLGPNKQGSLMLQAERVTYFELELKKMKCDPLDLSISPFEAESSAESDLITIIAGLCCRPGGKHVFSS